jgi:hypothetical protein
MSPKSLQKIKKKLQEMYKSPQNRKSSDLISIASQLGRVKDNRGKEPTYVRSHNPALSPPLSIPNHSREIKPGTTSSLSDLKEIGCKSAWLVYISPLFRPIEQLLAFKIVKIYPHPVTFSLRFFKSDRLLEVLLKPY